jgi:hypothetical protein
LEWRENEKEPTLIFRASLEGMSTDLRNKRMSMLEPAKKFQKSANMGDMEGMKKSLSSNISDFTLSILVSTPGHSSLSSSSSTEKVERWSLCNQFGGASPSKLALENHKRAMKLIPFGGVAFPLDATAFVGNVYCFLPLPILSSVPLSINGYFELSSNRRDIWFGDDMHGDGQLRSDWNKALLTDIIAPCWARLLLQSRESFPIGNSHFTFFSILILP